MIKQIIAFVFLLICTAAITTGAYFYFRSGWIAYHSAEASYKKKEYVQAINSYNSAMLQGVYTRVLVFHLGDALTAEKRFEEAAQLYRHYLISYPDDNSARLRLARVLSYSGDFEGAAKEQQTLLNKGIKEEPDEVK